MERLLITHWCNRVGSNSLVKLLQESLWVALKSKALKTKDLKRITIDTTVQEKAVQYPTVAALDYKAIEKLSQAAKDNGIELRQSYIRVGKTAWIMILRYRHAKKMKRAEKSMNKLKTYLGRLIRNVVRKANQIKNQQPKDREKLLSWYAP